ncbi:putative sulfate exporter family transporter, partial [bacterium]
PWVGHQLDLSQTQFGLWSALAIHDTSSVVGATLQYGAQALEIGTTVKLARALWIVPVAMLIGFLRSREKKTEVQAATKAKRPWFILGFIIAAALVTWVPALQPAGHQVESLAKRLMVLTLFLIGSNLTRATIQSVGIKPFVQGIALWIFMASSSLAAIYYGLIH